MTARYKFSVTTPDGTVLTRKSQDDFGYQWAAFVKREGDGYRIAYSKTREGAVKNLGVYYTGPVEAKDGFGVAPVTKTEIPKRKAA